MSEHIATVAWKRTSPGFTYETYNRSYEVAFDGGARLKGSASPAFGGEAEGVDPEESFVAALSSCHMLTFLAIAARKRLVVDSYTDEAVGRMEKNEAGRTWVSHVTLRPKVVFAGEVSAEELAHLHESAHKNCFIANSVKTEVVVEG